MKWMRGELRIDMKNPYSPAIRHFRGQLTNCPNTNSQVRRSPQSQLAQRNCLIIFHVKEADSWRCCQLNLAGSRGARRGLNETCEVKPLVSTLVVFTWYHDDEDSTKSAKSEHVSALLSAHVKDIRKRERIVICLALLRFSFLFSCCDVDAVVDMSLFASLGTVCARYAHPSHFPSENRQSDISIISTHRVVPSLHCRIRRFVILTLHVGTTGSTEGATRGNPVVGCGVFGTGEKQRFGKS